MLSEQCDEKKSSDWTILHWRIYRREIVFSCVSHVSKSAEPNIAIFKLDVNGIYCES